MYLWEWHQPKYITRYLRVIGIWMVLNLYTWKFSLITWWSEKHFVFNNTSLLIEKITFGMWTERHSEFNPESLVFSSYRQFIVYIIIYIHTHIHNENKNKLISRLCFKVVKSRKETMNLNAEIQLGTRKKMEPITNPRTGSLKKQQWWSLRNLIRKTKAKQIKLEIQKGYNQRHRCLKCK